MGDDCMPILCSRLTYFWRNMNISSIFYFSKSTSINTQYSSLWNTLKMMLFTKYLIKWKHIGRISWNFQYWFEFKSSLELDIKKMDVKLVQCPFKLEFHFLDPLCPVLFSLFQSISIYDTWHVCCMLAISVWMTVPKLMSEFVRLSWIMN